MKNFRVVVFASACSLAAMSSLMVACGDDDDSGPRPDGGSEGGDARPDQNAGDGATDGGFDARPDAPTPENFARQMEATICSSLTRCCFGDPNVADGGTVDAGGGTAHYDAQKCSSLVRNLGFEYAARGVETVDGGDVVAVDPAKGTACIEQLKTLSCNLTGPELANARKACFEAFMGTRDNGQACRASMDCKPGHFCLPDAGTCTPLRGDGGACGIYRTPNPTETDLNRDSNLSEEACSWRGSADTKLRCDSYDYEAGDWRPYDEWKCRPQVGVNGACNDTRWCADSICDVDEYVCKSPLPYFSLLCPRVID